jgi:hypothetical protein
MATSVFFNNYQSYSEQNLLEDLIIEAIKIYGHDMYYLPRKIDNKDKVFGEDTLAYYDKAYMVEMYIKNVEGFGGDGSFMSKFGLEIRDQITFTIAKRVFDDEVGSEEAILRPNEGDILFFPLNKKLFQIKYVDNKPVFYQMGALQVYDMACELFEYSSERFNTGIPEIDDIQTKLSLDVFDYAIKTEDGYMLQTEDGILLSKENFDIEEIDVLSDNDSIQQESDTFIDWSQIDPFSNGNV